MKYSELLATHPGVRPEADKIAGVIKSVVTAAQADTGSTVKLTTIFTSLIPLVTTLTVFISLNAEGKALVFAEAFDASMGTEDTALVREFLIFGAEETELISDSIKVAAFKVFHKQFLAAEAV